MTDCNGACCDGSSPPSPTIAPPAPSRGGERTALSIPGMDCPAEEETIRGKLTGMPGISGLDFNLLQRRLTLTHEPQALADALRALDALGLPASPQTEGVASGAQEREAAPGLPVRRWGLLAFAGVVAMGAEVADLAGSSTFLVIALSLVAIVAGGLKTYWKGLKALGSGTLNINALMSTAVTGAMVIGQWPEAAVVMVLFELAEVIESLSLDRARHAIQRLMAMAPETAVVRDEDGDWREVEAQRVVLEAIVRVAPGERIPLDGEVTEGASSVNQAPITGESLPVDKGPGDPVFAGTINQSGSFEYRVTRSAGDSTLARIIHAVEEAQGSRAPTQRFVDRFARIYTPAMFVLAVAVALVPPLALGQPLSTWVYRALVLLVIGCPCALVISTPVTVVSGLAQAARRGILIKGGAYLEEGRRLKALAFDKTGTITQGKPAVTDLLPLGEVDAEQVLRWGAGLAVRSDHPVSRAIAAYASARSLPLPELSEFAAIPGRGVRGRLNGDRLYLGSHRLLEDLGLCRADVERQLEGLEQQGKTAVVLMTEHRPLGLFGVADTVRPSSSEAIAGLHDLGIRTVMLSGDNQQTASAIAAQVGIDDARGGLLPDEKLAAIHELVEKYGEVGMAGDGVNDAPALAASSIGFAMGVAGSDTALETADVALMDDDLRKLPAFIRLSRRTARVLTENISLALGIKAVFLGLAVAGQATLWMAILADMGASLLVIFNGLRLLSVKAEPEGRPSLRDTAARPALKVGPR